MPMIAILTGDVINSDSQNPQRWVKLLSAAFEKLGPSPHTWEIYRGDEFQLRLDDPSKAFLTAVYIKSLLKSVGTLDLRIGIGLGQEDYKAETVTQSNGTAYVNSGRIFDQSQSRKTTMLIKSPFPDFDESFNLMLQLALTFMDSWTKITAETLAYVFQNPESSQQEIARQLDISQPTVSQRLNRAQYRLILKMNAHFENRVRQQAL